MSQSLKAASAAAGRAGSFPSARHGCRFLGGGQIGPRLLDTAKAAAAAGTPPASGWSTPGVPGLAALAASARAARTTTA